MKHINPSVEIIFGYLPKRGSVGIYIEWLTDIKEDEGWLLVKNSSYWN